VQHSPNGSHGPSGKAPHPRAGRLLDRLLVVLGALGLTVLFFLVLPLIQAIGEEPETLTLTTVDATTLPPPPPAPLEEEPEQEPEPEEEPPQLEPDSQPLDLAQLELALNPGLGDGWLGGDFAVDLGNLAGGTQDVEALFSMADLDQTPRALYQPGPQLDRALRRKAPGKVVVIFVVDQRGRVESPLVQSSSDPAFEKAALGAVKQWKFEPGKRNGEAVRFRMRVPITFPKDS